MGIFVLFVVVVYVLPPLFSTAVTTAPTFVQAGKTIAKSAPDIVNKLCDAKKVIDSMDQKLTIEIIQSIPDENDKVKVAKQNLVKIYNGVSLTVEELQTLNDLPKYYKLKLGVNDIGKKLKENPQILCNLIPK